jgi:hypothetical protein
MALLIDDNLTNVARSCGVFRYSITVGSSPLLQIHAKVLREVPQSGLW